MTSTDDKKLVQRFKQLSKNLKAEQRRLLEIASENDSLPSNNALRQIAELELNIAAVENNIAELGVK
ncbi:hypothetical protein [Brucella sp. NBRC 12950]|uniref:hypothetical protein n=1 Tax=Brucella sp. NBRC 12950 TaxID=2994518 RepID=UPI0024A0E896|nr:hypothetical protein [Brucella sp. NBRC 12950]GLU27496.1 hypothetical protein Brsp01_27290 [Brucella sp. NBRC 12950]